MKIKMNKNLILELNHQRKLMGLLNEGIIKSFVEGLKDIIRIGEGTAANISVFRSIFDSMDGAVINELESLGIKNFDEMAQDLKLPFKVGGVKNPAKKIVDVTAQKIVKAFEGVIFKDKRFSHIGDMVVDSFFNLKNANEITRKKYYELVHYAETGELDLMVDLKQELVNNIDKTFLDFATSKYVAHVAANAATPKNWFQKLFSGLTTGASLSLLFKSTYKNIPSDKTDRLLTRFFALANSIENKMQQQTGDYVFDYEKVELAKIGAEIARTRKENLRNLWLKWRELMPADMVKQIEEEGIENSPKYIQYVKYFENNVKLGPEYKNGKILEIPSLLTSRLEGLGKLFTGDKTRTTWLGRNIYSRAERLATGFLFSDPRTFKEWFANYQILGRSKARMIGFTLAEKAIGFFIYYPLIMGTLQSMLDFLEKEGGYKKDANGNLLFDKNGNPIPNIDVPGGDGSKFLKDHKEGFNSFFQVWTTNAAKKYGFATDEVLNFKAFSLGAGMAWEFYNRKDIANRPEDIGTNKVDKKAAVTAEIDKTLQKGNAEIDSLKKKLSDLSGKLDSTSRAAAGDFINNVDSLRSRVTGKTDKIVNIDSVDF